MFLSSRSGIAIVAFCVCAANLPAQEAEESYRDKALGLNRVTGDTAITSKIRELRKDRPALSKLLAEATTMVKDNEKNPPLNYTASFILARSGQAIKDYDSSEFFYKLCIEHAFKLKSTQKIAQVFEGLIDLFERTKKYDDALFTCEKFLKLDVGKEDENIERVKPFVAERVVQIQCRKKEFDKALETVDKLLELYDDSWYFMQRKAEVLREMGKAEEGVKLLGEAIEKVDNQDNLKEEDRKRYANHCKYMLSGMYIDLNQPDKCIEVLDELVKAEPDSATYHNDLGYVLADNDRRLADAEQHLNKALELDRAERKKLLDDGSIVADDDKDNSAYLDSLAWVYFKQKKYDQALEYMNKVVESEDSQHVEIYDHLAEIHMALGHKPDAVKAWEKALTLENISGRDDARKASIKKKLEANK